MSDNLVPVRKGKICSKDFGKFLAFPYPHKEIIIRTLQEIWNYIQDYLFQKTQTAKLCKSVVMQHVMVIMNRYVEINSDVPTKLWKYLPQWDRNELAREAFPNREYVKDFNRKNTPLHDDKKQLLLKVVSTELEN